MISVARFRGLRPLHLPRMRTGGLHGNRCVHTPAATWDFLLEITGGRTINYQYLGDTVYAYALCIVITYDKSSINR